MSDSNAVGPMTNYPTDGVDSFWEVWDSSPRRALKLAVMAIEMADWSPRKWARLHDQAVDLPSAWWIACHAADVANDDITAESP